MRIYKKDKMFVEKLINIISIVMLENNTNQKLREQCRIFEEVFHLNGLFFPTSEHILLLEYDYEDALEVIYITSNEIPFYYELSYKDIDNLSIKMEEIAPKLYDLVWCKWYTNKDK